MTAGRDEANLTPELLLRAYAMGVFPMAEARDDPEIFWVDPRHRGILPLDRFHISRSLARRMRRGDYDVRINGDFEATLRACADRDETWINDRILRLYCDLHDLGAAHSLEIWQDTKLIGGVYGVTLGGAFFGESMFSHSRDASKLALAYLVDLLGRSDFELFDTQFITPHLQSLGAVEISRNAYHRLLARAISQPAHLLADAPIPDAQDVIHRNAQTS